MQKVRPKSVSKLRVLSLAALLPWFAVGCSGLDSGLDDVPGADQPFPTLASVPDRPTGYATPAERQAEKDKLVFDRAAAAPLGSTAALAATAPGPAPAAALATTVPAVEIDQRDILSGGWLNAGLSQKQTRALAGLVFFDSGSAELKPKGRDILRAVAALQRERGGVIRLIGHASSLTAAEDPAEAAEINRRVARRRAEATAAELPRLGLAADQIQLDSDGAAAPAYDEATPAGEAGNRRVEIYLEL